MSLLLTANRLLFRRRAQATLALVFLIGGIIVVIGVSLAFVVASFIASGYGFRLSNQALAIASGGINDAVIKLVRNKDYSAASPYSVPIGAYAASVTVTQNSPVSGQVTIVSAATVGSYTRKVKAVVAVDSSSGQVQLVSWDQLAL
jgi:uncharacterized protein (UPF0333 family)